MIIVIFVESLVVIVVVIVERAGYSSFAVCSP